MGQPLHAYLEEFPSGAPLEREGVAARFQNRSASSAPPASENPVEARIAAAHANGVEVGQAMARQRFDDETAMLRADFDRRLEETRSGVSQVAAQTIISTIAAQVGDLRTRLVEQMAAAVLPVLRHALTEATVRELAAELHTLIGDAETVAVEISGPADILERIWETYLEHRSRPQGGPLPQMTFGVGASVEVRITVDDAIVESRLFEWIGRTMEAVG